MSLGNQKARPIRDRILTILHRWYLTVCALVVFSRAPEGTTFALAVAVAIYLDLCRRFYIDDVLPPRWTDAGEALRQPLPLERFAPRTADRSFLLWWLIAFLPFAYTCLAVYCFHAFPDNGIIPPARFRDDVAFRLAEPLFGILAKHRDTLLQHQLAAASRVALILHVTAVSLLAALVSTTLLVSIGVRWQTGLLINGFSPTSYKEYLDKQRRKPPGIPTYVFVLVMLFFVVDLWPIDLVYKRKAYMPQVSNFDLLLYQFFLAMMPVFLVMLYLTLEVRRFLRADRANPAAPSSEPIPKPIA